MQHLLLKAALVLLAALQPAWSSPPPSAAVFAAGTTLRRPTLSPDATRIALVVSHAGGEAVVVRPLEGGTGRPVYRFDDPELSVSDLRWLDAQRLLLRLTASGRDTSRIAVPSYALLIVNATTGEPTTLYNGPGVRVFWGNDRARLVDLPLPSAENLLLVTPEEGGAGVIRIDTQSALRTRVQRSIEKAVGYWGDAQGELRVLVRRDGERSEMLVREPDARGWKTARTWQADAPDAWWLLGFDGSDTRHFLVRGRHEGQPAVLRVDLSQPDAPPQWVARDPAIAKAQHLVRHPGTGAALGVAGGDSEFFWAETLQTLEGGLRAALPGQGVRLLQWLGDDYLVSTASPTEPERLWHGKRSLGALSPLMSARPALPAQLELRSERLTLGSVRVDLLRPSGNEKLPVVWCLQCGLQSSEMVPGAFNPLAAFLATRGWAVLQVQALGGSGRTLMERARSRDARLRPLLDLALSQPALGLDANRVAVLGYNLLGFDALRWAAEEPKRFRAVITLDAMTDLPLYAELDREPIAPGFRASVREALADLDEAAQRAASPRYQAARYPGALLLVHGERSGSVDAEHARRLADARRAAGLPVELLLLKDSSGEVLHARYREQVLVAVEALLRQAFSAAD